MSCNLGDRTSVTIQWSVPTCTGGVAISTYYVYINDGMSSSWSTVNCVPGIALVTSPTCGITGLTTGATYTVKVSAVNAAGTGTSSPTLSIIAAVAPSAPSQPTLVSSTKTSISVAWTAPSDDGGSTLTTYELYGKASTDTTWTLLQSAAVSVLTYTQSGIATAGTWLQYKVRALSSFGYSDFSTVASFVAAAPPTMSAPTSASATKTSITVAWTVSDTGGSAPTGYILSQTATATGTSVVVYNGAGVSSTLSYTSTSVTTGASYTYTVVGINAAGTGSSSASSVAILAATVPGIPSPMIYVSSTATTIVLKFGNPSSDDGGSAVLSRKLYMSVLGGTLAVVTQYNGVDSTYTLDQTVITTLVTGTTYQFASTSVNAVGESAKSDLIMAGLGALAAQMATPTVDYSTATGTSLTISWAAATSASLPVTGYLLYMHNSPAAVVYNGSIDSTTRTVTITGLTKGKIYYFYVVALNANGASLASPELTAYSCALPSGLAAPTLSTSTTTSLYLKWTPPTSDGGCSLTQYSLYRNDGAGGSVTTEVDATTFSANPTLTTYNVASLTSSGSTYQFKLRAITSAGYVESSVASFVLASVPVKPATLTYDATTSSAQSITLTFPTVSTANTGGSALTGTELLRALYASSTYSTVIRVTTGILTTYTDTSSSLVKGSTYKYRYRLANANGWSDYSDDLLVTAGSVPGKPAAPSVTTLAATQLTFSMSAPTDEGGLALTQMDLEMGSSIVNPTFAIVKSGAAGTYTVSTADGLTAGQLYSFRCRAKNAAGYGAYSDITLIGAGTTPTSAPTLTATVSKSSSTSVYLSWTAVTPATGELSILGYTVSYKLATDSTYQQGYDGSSNPSQLYAMISGLTAGSTYSFLVYAVNFNGKSTASTEVQAKACGIPGTPAAPTLTSTSTSGITVAWVAPSSNGGCDLSGYDLLIYSTSTSAYVKVNSGSDADPTVLSFVCATTTCLPSGATLGDQFIFKVRAKNSAPGTSADSDASSSMKYAGVPSDPTAAPSVVASATTASQISVQYSAVASANGSPVTAYEVQMALDSGTLSFSTVQSSLSLTATVSSGISSGQTYVFRYRAINAIGTSGWSSTVAIQAAAAPSKMTAPTISLSGTNMRIIWTAATANGSPISAYNVQVMHKTSLSYVSLTCDATTALNSLYCDVTPAILKSTYGYSDYDVPAARVSATNSVGTGSWSEASSGGVMIPTVPGKPGVPPVRDASIVGTSIKININTLTGTTATGGATITGYTIQWDQGTSTWTALQTNAPTMVATVSSLTLGTSYAFKYCGVNSMGTGTYSDTLTVKAVNVPDQVSVPTVAYSATTNVQLTWTAPNANGGTISLYKVLAQDSYVANAYCSEGVKPTTTCTIPMSSFWATPFSLTTPGTTIKMQVQAYNEAGWGTISSAATGGVTTQTKPLAPSNPPAIDTTTSTATQLVVVWQALSSSLNGGSAVTGYTLYWDSGSGSTLSATAYTGTATTVTLTTGITGATAYQFAYAASNVYGLGATSSSVTITSPNGVPGTPGTPTTSISGTTVTVAWTAPSVTGGSSISYYNIYIRDSTSTYTLSTTECNKPTSTSCTIDVSTLQATFTLVAGNEVKAKVEAVNTDGYTSAKSAETASGCTI